MTSTAICAGLDRRLSAARADRRRVLPANSVPELIRLAKSRPGQLAFGSAGNGSIEHVAAEVFGRQAKIQILHVPYRGAAPAIIDLIGEQIQAILTTTTTAINNLKGGRIKPLMVATAKRLATLPDVKTARESGLPGFEIASTYGILAPAGTPPAIVARLNREFANIVAVPDVKTRFQQLGVETTAMPPEEAGAAFASKSTSGTKSSGSEHPDRMSRAAGAIPCRTS